VKLRYPVLAGLLAGGAVACLAQASTQPFEPGLWEVSATVTANGVARAPVVDRQCLSPAEAAKGPQAMLLGAGAGCTASRSTIADGKLDALFNCADSGRPPTSVAITGSFTPKSYDAVSTITDGLMTRRISVTGKWVGACSS
jgi:hypothetical protein